MYEVERFIEEAYQIAGRAYATYFQVQFITVNIDSIDLLVVQNAEINYIRGTKSQKTKQKQREHNKQLKGNKNGKKKMTKMRSSCIGLVRYGEVKQDRIRKTCNLICKRADIHQRGIRLIV